VLCKNESHAIWTSPEEKVEEKEEERKKCIWQLSGSVLSPCFFAPPGVLFVMKTLEDECMLL